MFYIWWDWTNRHKRPKAFPSCWPNAEKAKTQRWPRTLSMQKLLFLLKWGNKKEDKNKRDRERVCSLPKKKQMGKWPIEWRVRERRKKKKMKRKRKKQGSSKQHGKYVWNNVCVCGTCLSTASMLGQHIQPNTWMHATSLFYLTTLFFIWCWIRTHWTSTRPKDEWILYIFSW